jgi:hypothetical protein
MVVKRVIGKACCFLNDRNQDERIKGPTNGLGLCNAKCSVCQPQAAGTHGTCFHGPTTQAWRGRQSRTCDDHAVKFASADATRPRIRTEIEWRERRAVRCSWRMSAWEGICEHLVYFKRGMKLVNTLFARVRDLRIRVMGPFSYTRRVFVCFYVTT